MKLLSKTLKKIYSSAKRSRTKKAIVNYHHDVLNSKANAPDFRKLGFSVSESEIYSLNVNDYREYITTWEAYQPRLRSTKYFAISDDKYLFSLVFGNYVRVPETIGLIEYGKLISIKDNSFTIDTIFEKAHELGGLVIKDRMGSDGFNVYVISENKDHKLTYKNSEIDEKALKDIVSQFRHGIIQRLVKQGDYGDDLYPRSINTIRIITMKKAHDNEHEIVAALQRIGSEKSAPVDNFNQGGFSSLIDIDTGRLGKMSSMFSTDDSGNRIFYREHPDTGNLVEGKVVPGWKELKRQIIELTAILPFFEYIAWDVAIQDDGFTIIETNMKSSLNVFQIHGGMRNKSVGEKYREHGYLTEKW